MKNEPKDLSKLSIDELIILLRKLRLQIQEDLDNCNESQRQKLKQHIKKVYTKFKEKFES